MWCLSNRAGMSVRLSLLFLIVKVTSDSFNCFAVPSRFLNLKMQILVLNLLSVSLESKYLPMWHASRTGKSA